MPKKKTVKKKAAKKSTKKTTKKTAQRKSSPAAPKPAAPPYEKNSKNLFFGCFLVGMGLGFLFGNVVVGIFLGLGVGFFASHYAKKKCNARHTD